MLTPWSVLAICSKGTLGNLYILTVLDTQSLITATSHLAPTIQNSEQFRTRMSQFPPTTSGKHRETKSFAAIMDETVGFMD